MERKKFIITVLIGLAIYAGLNFLLLIIYATAAGEITTYFDSLAATPTRILETLFVPIIKSPYTGGGAQIVLVVSGNYAVDLIYACYFLIPGIITAVVLAQLTEKRYECVAAWFLVAIVSFLLLLVEFIRQLQLAAPGTWPGTIALAIFSLVVNLAFYGFFALASYGLFAFIKSKLGSN